MVYVIHAEEEAILKPLEEIWVNIKLQTGWRLESCSRPVEILTESLHLHSNQNNIDDGQAHSGITTTCNDVVTAVPAESPPSIN